MKGIPEKVFSELNAEERAELRIFAKYIDNLNRLKRNRINDFDEKGMLEVRLSNGDIVLQNGKEFICDMVAFFEAEDEPYCYRYCAELQLILDEFLAKYYGKT